MREGEGGDGGREGWKDTLTHLVGLQEEKGTDVRAPWAFQGASQRNDN